MTPTPQPSDQRPGDLVFCHSAGIVGKLIRLGQWLNRKTRSRGWYQENHVAVLDRWDPVAGDWTIIQAESRGVTDQAYLSSVTPNGNHRVVPLPSTVDRDAFVWFMRSQVGAHYGFLTIASIAFNILTPSFVHVDFRHDTTWICSAVASGGLWFAGWRPITIAPDLYSVTPAQLDQLINSAAPGKGQ